jgi:predicted ribosome quality control (RQC) complex YloA/Tae2 family protein
MNGIYLNLLLREITSTVRDQYIRGILIHERLVQVIFDNSALFISLYPDASGIYYGHRVKGNFHVLQILSGNVRSARICDVKQIRCTPVVKFILDKNDNDKQTESELIVSLYREAPNICHKRGQVCKKIFSRFIEKKPKDCIDDYSAGELASIARDAGTRVGDVVLKQLEGVDKNLAGELTADRLQQLRRIVSGEKTKPRILSFVPLIISLFAEDYLKAYASFNELYKDAVQRYVKEKRKAEFEAKKKKQIISLQKRIKKLKKQLLDPEDLKQCRIKGELLLSNIAHIKKGVKNVRLFNPYTDEEIVIDMDPAMTPQQNAQEYFGKYKKAKRGRSHIQARIKALEIELAQRKKSTDNEHQVVSKPAKKKEKTEPFRKFMLLSGSVIFVGKNARSNDMLTFNFAGPQDYFFHVRGFEGSHVLLRARVPRGQRPKKEDMAAAASLAVYFSKAKTQKKVPVSYTQRKYLKKNKKGKQGSVTLIREEVMFADPKLPDD